MTISVTTWAESMACFLATTVTFVFTRGPSAPSADSFCHSCGFRHTSDVAMREHKMMHDKRRMEPKPILPTPRPLMPPPTKLKEEVIVIPDDGAVKEGPTEGDECHGRC